MLARNKEQAMLQAAMMQAQSQQQGSQQQQQLMNAGVNQGYLPHNFNATQQAHAQLGQARQGLPGGGQYPQVSQAMMNAALQRAAAAGQMQFKNGQVPLGQQQGAEHPNLQQFQAAALQQLQAQNNAQKLAQQLQNLSQLEAAVARNNSLMYNQGQNAATSNAAMLQSLEGAQAAQAANWMAARNLQQLQQQHQSQAAAQGQAGRPNLTMQQLQQANLAHALLQARAQQQSPAGGNPAQMYQAQQLQQQLLLLQARAQAQQQQQAQAQQQQQMAQVLQLQERQQRMHRLQQMHQAAQSRAATAAAAGIGKDMPQSGANGFPPRTNSESNAANPLTGSTGSANQEQRRLALACVALQLARGGMSVERAINSGIMGGMSVSDVKFIVECYNAERFRMMDAGAKAGGDGNVQIPEAASTEKVISSLQQQAKLERQLERQAGGEGCVSPGAPRSDTSRRTSNASMVQAATAAAEMANNLPQEVVDANAFNAFSYGFFGNTNPAEGGLEEDLEGGLEDAAGLLGGLAQDAESLEALSCLDPGSGLNGSALTNLAGGELDMALVGDGGGGGDAVVGGWTSSPSGAVGSPKSAVSGSSPTAASSANGLGSGQQSLGAQALGMSEADAEAWLQAAANANKPLWEGVAEEEEEEQAGNDDLDARLANLDLGSGFF
eukprot:gene31414-6582_t